ncbi:MAG: glycosyltransferase, partial [Gammaproteobacteria bacterium]|nr:glycosyltransferase [Gammaproteobacteria bacterium]
MTKRVLIIIPSLAGVGGAESLVHSLSELLSTHFDVYQASFDPPGTQRRIASPVQFFPLGPAPRLPLFLRWITYGKLAWRLSQLKRRLQIDISISNLWGADLISLLSLGSDRKIALGLINIKGNPTNRLMERFRGPVGMIYRRFDRVLAISDPLADELRSLYGLSSDRVSTFRNFVRPTQPVPAWSRDGVARFVFCGRLVPEKNLDALLAAWAAFAKGRAGVQLVVLGDGPLGESSRALAQSLALDTANVPTDNAASVLFLGNVVRPEDYMAGARAFVLPSRHEGVPTVLLLALALRLPLLAADARSGGVRDLLGIDITVPTPVDFGAGLLLPIPDASDDASMQAWTSALSMACDNEQQVQQWMAGAATLSLRNGIDTVRDMWL